MGVGHEPISEVPFKTTLDELIPPQVTDDALAEAIEQLAARAGVREILDIGSFTGEGSSAAWVRGVPHNPERPRLATTSRAFPLSGFPPPADVERFYREVPSRLQHPASGNGARVAQAGCRPA